MSKPKQVADRIGIPGRPLRRTRETVRQAAIAFVLGALTWSGLMRLGLAQLASPADLDLTLWAGFAAALVGLTHWRRAIWASAIATTFLLLLVGYTPLLRPLAQNLVLREPPHRADAVVVLSSSVNDDGNLDRQGFDRLVGGMALLRDGYAPVLVRTWMAPPVPSPLNDVQRTLRLLPQSVSVEAVGPVASTRDEALAVKSLYDRRGWKRLLLVTSPLHTARSAATFRKAGMSVITVPCEGHDYALATLGHPEERYRAFRLWAREELAWALYRFRGWV